MMYNKILIDKFIEFIEKNDGIGDKEKLAKIAKKEFFLTQDRKVFACRDFAVRFCAAASKNFGNTVLSLSKLQKYDNIPFIVCIVTPSCNYLLLANTTFLKKISHSSQELRVDNIKGSFNGSDILRNCFDKENDPSNFEFLFSSHEAFTFDENLKRLVEETNNILPKGRRFEPTEEQLRYIKESVNRAVSFLNSNNYEILDRDLRCRVDAVSSEIAIAAFIENVNIRGRIIEYLITARDDLRQVLIDALASNKPLPPIYTSDKLGDYEFEFENYYTATDIKTKVLFLTSNPKGYNIDKLLQFLAKSNSVYLIFIVAIDKDKSISTKLCSMYNHRLLEGTRIVKHWAGRNSRGVTQYDGKALEDIVSDYDSSINRSEAENFIELCLYEKWS